MDKRELFQIRSIIKEIECLQRQLDRAEYQAETRQTTVAVKGSMRDFPYVEHTIKLTGVDMEDYIRKVKRLRIKLKHRIDELMATVEEAHDYIAGIPDPDVRLILQLRFVKGLTWGQIEEETGMSEATCKRKYRRWRDFYN